MKIKFRKQLKQRILIIKQIKVYLIENIFIDHFAFSELLMICIMSYFLLRNRSFLEGSLKKRLTINFFIV